MQSMKRRRLSADAWREMVAKFEGSALSAEGFSQQERISAASLQRWHGKLRAQAGNDLAQLTTRAAARSVPGAFVDLGALGSSGSRLELRLEFGGGVVLQLSRG